MTSASFPQSVPANPKAEDMTLRDYFASHAMQGMIAYDPLSWGSPIAHGIASNAYAVADAMLKFRSL